MLHDNPEAAFFKGSTFERILPAKLTPEEQAQADALKIPDFTQSLDAVKAENARRLKESEDAHNAKMAKLDEEFSTDVDDFEAFKKKLGL